MQNSCACTTHFQTENRTVIFANMRIYPRGLLCGSLRNKKEDILPSLIPICRTLLKPHGLSCRIFGRAKRSHADNLGAADKNSRLLPADEAYWKHITTKISVDHFEKKCASDNHFAGQYSRVLPKLRKTAERFATDMADLYRDGTSVTVTHGDLQDMVGDHVRCFQGRPMIIDWGFSRLAPFYIDLVDYFTQEEALLYLYICIRRWLNTSVGTGIS